MEVNDKKDKMKVRGTATFYANGDMDFSAQKEGAPSQEVLKKSKTGKLYRTTSKENPKLCAYLSCDADAPDAAQRLEEQLAEFTAGFGTKPKKEPQPLARDRVLWDADDVRIWYSVKDKAVKVNLSLPVAARCISSTYRGIERTCDYQRQYLATFPAGLCPTKPRNVPTTRNTGHADMRRRSGAGTDSRQLRCQHQRPRELQATYLQVGR